MTTIQNIAALSLALKRTSESDSSDTEGGSLKKQQPRRRTYGAKNITKKVSSENSFPTKYLSEEESFDAEAFLDKRVMTPNQERFNAITMIPGMIYSIYFIFAGCWIKAGDDQHDDHPFHQSENSDWSEMAREAFGSENGWKGSFGCIRSSSFPNLTALPPLPVVAAAVGILVHSPFSIMYHWKYATSIEPSYRVKHWSRRLDHAFIHFASACAAYATSGRVDFFLLNAAFNLDCAYRQFEEKVRPKRNLNRIASSVFLYLLPVLMHKQYLLFFQFFFMFASGAWLFVQYPLGGWSHGVFHLVLSCLPHLIMKVAMQLESSQLQINLAVKCAAMAGQL
ncbi:hypothetical protein ACHAXA_004323 [Cyclostephanos tholiformis]|uniref:Uncharacterized protein n=1 Tax=Cyclostephanos tholiformis TaxID=382380 RepID=A0ABD3SQ33_9STRA